MEQAVGLTITPRFNSVSELSFSIYKTYNDYEIPYYDQLLKNKLVHVIGFGYFVITNITETLDGGVPVKEMSCYSYEYTLNYKGVNILPNPNGTNKTYAFYNPIAPEESLLHLLLQLAPNWKVGTVSTSLYTKYRTFEPSDGNLYGFLMDDVSKSYEVIFEFDTENLLVNAYAPEDIVKNTDIVLTFDNLLKNVNINELDDDIVTVLKVSGADNLSIALVNPLGDKRLYDFSYYLNSKWFSDAALIAKVKQWQDTIETLRPAYSAKLTELKTRNRELLVLQTSRQDLVNEKSALEIVRKTIDPIQYPTEFRQKTNEIDAKEAEIIVKNNQITAKNNQILAVNTELGAINNQVRYTSYFTVEERLLLDPYIIEGEYTDGNFIVTDAMRLADNADSNAYVITTTGTKQIKDLTSADIIIDEQYISEQLLEQGRSVLKTMSQPSYTFSMDSQNFLFIEKFARFQQQLMLGHTINIELDDGDWIAPLLLELNIDYDNPTSFSMTFGNRFRLSDAEWTFADLHNEQVKTVNRVGSTLAVAAEPVLNGQVNDMQRFLTNQLDASLHQITSTSDNEFTLSGQGLMGRRVSNDSGSVNGYDPHQLWINNELIVMSDDAWQSAKLAIGYIRGEGAGYYGVNAEVIAGNLIAGQQLNITNSSGSFKVDANKVSITNLELEMTRGNNRIVLNPTVGMQMYAGNTRRFDVNIQTGNVEATGRFRSVGVVDPNGILKFTQIDKEGLWIQNSTGTTKRGVYNNTSGEIVSNTDALYITAPNTSGRNEWGDIWFTLALEGPVGFRRPIFRMRTDPSAAAREAVSIYVETNANYPYRGFGRINVFNHNSSQTIGIIGETQSGGGSIQVYDGSAGGVRNSIITSTGISINNASYGASINTTSEGDFQLNVAKIGANPRFIAGLKTNSITQTASNRQILWTTGSNEAVIQTDFIQPMGGSAYRIQWIWNSQMGRYVLCAV